MHIFVQFASSHQLFVLSYARLLADQLSISVPQCVLHPETATLETHVDACLIGYTPPSFLPASTRIVTDESESPAQEVMGRSTDTALNSVDTDALDEFTISALRMSITALQDPTRLKKIYSCRPISFQKDNDQLAHVDFITAASVSQLFYIFELSFPLCVLVYDSDSNGYFCLTDVGRGAIFCSFSYRFTVAYRVAVSIDHFLPLYVGWSIVISWANRSA
ncbi:unnamed protein product [Dicrocoelium dendriticum]|nr:unnamed protein product [Dicrocoelium dendriticum]